MVKNLFFLILITSFIYSCGNQGDKNTVNDKSLEAFQKVDNKNSCMIIISFITTILFKIVYFRTCKIIEIEKKKI